MPPRATRASALDPARLFGPEARRSPDMEAVWDWVCGQDAQVPNWLTLPAAEGRALQNRLGARWNADLPAVAAEEALTIGGVPGRLVVPRGTRPGCILFVHGGGWAFGSLDGYARFSRLLAEATATRVLLVDYRLSPEHPFPAGFDDVLAVWRSLAGGEAPAELAGGPLAVAGDSAGANFALALTLHEVAAEQRRPDLGLLFYGAYGADLDTPSYRRFAEGFGLGRAGMAQFYAWYLDGSPARWRDDPRVAPLAASEADLARLPPLFLNAAGLDPLLSDTLALAARLEAAGVEHRFVLHEGVHHGFMQLSLRLPEAAEAIREAGAFFVEQTGR